jgi:2'-5' RNA ligase
VTGTPSRSLRLFVALDPPDAVRRRLAAIQGELRGAAGRSADEVRWVRVEDVHLTLQFLGAVPEERLPAVTAAVAAVAAASPQQLHLEVRGAGAFPSARRARVLWAGVTGEVAPLASVATELGRQLAPLGFPPEERAFSPHLTLGRSRDQRGLPGLAAALARCGEGVSARWAVTELVLYRSHLSPQGARYEALSRARLGGGGSR